MTRKTILYRACGLAWVVVLAAIVVAGRPDAVGSLVGSRNATLDGHAPLPYTVLLSGDNIAVNKGLAMLTLERGNRMILGRDSEAILLREADMLTVRMARGNLSLYHPPEGSRLRVKAGDVIVTPSGGPGTLGELSLADGLLVVTARDGSLKVTKEGFTQEVEKGHTLTVSAAASHAPEAAQSGTLPASSHAAAGTTAVVGAALASGGATVASIASTRSNRQVSPVTPGP